MYARNKVFALKIWSKKHWRWTLFQIKLYKYLLTNDKSLIKKKVFGT